MVIKDDRSIEEPTCRGRNHEHVHRGDVGHVIAQEAAPSRGGVFGPPRHVSPNSGLTHLDTELEQLAVDPRRSPQRICRTHLPDQIADLGGDLGSPRPECP
jgi:hypothetical protein